MDLGAQQEVEFPGLGQVVHRTGQSELKVHLDITGGLQVDGMREMKEEGWLHESLGRGAEPFRRP